MPKNISLNKKIKRKFRLNSFFAGIGGFDVGFERNGFETTFLCEINPFCNEVLASHWPKVSLFKDINELTAENIPEADVWSGGFPCQDISVARGASKRLGLQGLRSGLFFQYANLIEEKKPAVVLIENVEGLFNSNGGRDFGIILQRMTQMGYAVAWRLVNSRYFGVPQSRTRVYICCWYKDPIKAINVMFDASGAHVITNERKDFITEASLEHEFPKVPKVAYCLAATSGRHTGTDWSRTYVVCNDGVRRMTPLEYERLQGFPDGWSLPKGVDANSDDVDTMRYTAIGNAVSVPVVEWFSKKIYNELNEIKSKKSPIKYAIEQIPEFGEKKWENEFFDGKDFTDISSSYKWPVAGIAWKNGYIGGKVNPCPSRKIESSLINVVEKRSVQKKYYLTANACEGILRRVDRQNRSLFAPLRHALEKKIEEDK